MDLAGYKIFEAVASFGNMAKAAEQMHLTPSAVSHAILKLEKEFGFPLFIREAKGVKPTTYAEEILPQIRSLLQLHSNIAENASLLRGIKRGTVRIGTFNSTCSVILSKLLPLMLVRYPNIKVILHEGGYSDCAEWLRTKQVDLAFVHETSYAIPNYTHLLNDPMLCIAPRNWEPHDTKVTLEELSRMPLFLSDDGYLHDVKKFFAERSFQLTSHHSIQDDSSIIALVESGLGCSILPKMVIDGIRANVNVFPIEHNPFRPIGIASLQEPYCTPAARVFCQEITEFVSNNSSHLLSGF